MTETAGPPLEPVELGAYFALIEVAGLLRHAVEQQLREEGDLSYVQFQLLARLGLDSTTGSERMTELADGVVYSRSGLTYQAGLLEKAGLVTRAPAADDERGVTVVITQEGRDRVARVRDHLRSAPPRSALQRRARRSTGPDLDPGPDPAAGSVRGGQTDR